MPETLLKIKIRIKKRSVLETFKALIIDVKQILLRRIRVGNIISLNL